MTSHKTLKRRGYNVPGDHVRNYVVPGDVVVDASGRFVTWRPNLVGTRVHRCQGLPNLWRVTYPSGLVEYATERDLKRWQCRNAGLIAHMRRWMREAARDGDADMVTCWAYQAKLRRNNAQVYHHVLALIQAAKGGTP